MIEGASVGESVLTHYEYLDDEAMTLYHSASDILVYPYRNITQSGALLTGMGFGKPIVATRVGGFVETLADGRGELIPPDDPEALGSAILRLALDSAERARLGRAARDYIDASHNWDRAAERTAELYASLQGMSHEPSARNY
jgi:glycosyltransferase involved in cell wall biosynthesis